MKLDLVRPCAACPFRTDVTPFISWQRAKEICDALLIRQATFQCHKTVDYDKADEDGEVAAHVAASEKNAQHCAGATIMLEKMDRPNQWMRIAERIGKYDRRKLDMSSPVYGSASAMVAAHRRRRK